MEVWKPVFGFENYEVSNRGNVRHIKHKKLRSLRLYKGCSYFFTNFKKDGKLYTRKVHRLVLEAFLGEKPAGLVSDHINRNKLDNRLENLRYCTYGKNRMNTIFSDKRQLFLLKEAQKKKEKLAEYHKIKKDINSHKFTQYQIAKKYSVHYSTVSLWARGLRKPSVFRARASSKKAL